MIKLYRKIENRWFGLPQKIRFLLVGGFNTFLAYLLFVLFVAILQIPYRLSLIIQYVLTVNISIFSMRYYVFRSGGNLKDEYFRLGCLSSHTWFQLRRFVSAHRRRRHQRCHKPGNIYRRFNDCYLSAAQKLFFPQLKKTPQNGVFFSTFALRKGLKPIFLLSFWRFLFSRPFCLQTWFPSWPPLFWPAFCLRQNCTALRWKRPFR